MLGRLIHQIDLYVGALFGMTHDEFASFVTWWLVITVVLFMVLRYQDRRIIWLPIAAGLIGYLYHNLQDSREAVFCAIYIAIGCVVLLHYWRLRWKGS